MEDNRLVLEGRKSLFVSGVKDIRTFSEDHAEAETTLGTLMISGKTLHLDLLDLEKGEARLSGTVDALWYPDDGASTKKGFFSRLFYK